MSMPPQRRRLRHKSLAGRKISSTDNLHYREDPTTGKGANIQSRRISRIWRGGGHDQMRGYFVRLNFVRSSIEDVEK
jgi:hypothetical protein